MKKANELRTGDTIKTETYSNLWGRMIETTAVVMGVTFFGENASVMVKAKDGFKEIVTEIFATPAKLFQMA